MVRCLLQEPGFDLAYRAYQEVVLQTALQEPQRLLVEPRAPQLVEGGPPFSCGQVEEAVEMPLEHSPAAGEVCHGKRQNVSTLPLGVSRERSRSKRTGVAGSRSWLRRTR